MKHLCYCLLSFITLLTINGASVPLKVEIEKTHQMDISRGDGGIYSLRSTGGDPQIVLTVDSAAQVSPEAIILAFEYFCPDGVDFVEVFYTREGRTDWSQSRQVEGGALPRAEAWQPYAINMQLGSTGKWTTEDRAIRIDFGREPGIELQVRNFHLRAPTEEERMDGAEIQARLDAKTAKAEKVDRYLMAESTPAQVTAVTVKADTIIVEGRINSALDGTFHLIEFRPHQDPWSLEGGTILTEDTLSPSFRVTLPRFDGERDRIAHRFGVAAVADSAPRLISHAVWASDVSGAAVRDMPRLRPSNKKGLGGVSYKKGIFEQDLEDLGISAATINFPLGGIVNPGTNPITYEHQGRTWRYNRAKIAEFDQKIQWLTERDIVVSAILLVDDNAGILVHPEYNTAGIYSMANMTTEAGTDAYRALVSFLAERYSRPDRAHGWISHWIVFNEIDYAWTWTNMGEQPMPLYMDTFDKAMRLTWLEVRRFNPTAEVFISLTHSWDYSPSNSFRAYAPRALLDRMALYTQQLGDYHWGVAYHPYPQSLLRPRTWEDTLATAAFDTRYITPKNIEVLDAYLHQDPFLYDGAVRTVLLSEQGFHTPDYSDASLRDKAAAIAYTWEKILPLASVETFHYHRWVDHPLEGGLKVGLRTLPEPGKPFGERKEPAFSVFSALETEDHADAIQPLKTILGIDCWSEIRIDPSEIKR